MRQMRYAFEMVTVLPFPLTIRHFMEREPVRERLIFNALQDREVAIVGFLFVPITADLIVDKDRKVSHQLMWSLKRVIIVSIP
jgi:hypothetical protein